MGFVSRIKRPVNMTTAELEKALISASGSTAAGKSVNTESAMRLITVQNCVRVRAFTIGQLPCQIIKEREETQDINGEPTQITFKEQAKDYPLYELLHDQPNSWMTSSEFWAMAEAYVSMRGNFLAFKFKINGQLKELIPIAYDRIEEIKQLPDYSITYKIRHDNGKTQTLNNTQVLHLRGLTLNGYTGMNPIEYARETIGTGLAGNDFLNKYYSKGLHPSAVLKHPRELNSQTYDNLRDAFKEKYAGLKNSSELMLIDEGMEIDFPQIKLIDAQFLEQAKLNESQICGLFRVPLMLVQSTSNTATFASAEQFMISYTRYGITPDIVNYEKAIRRDLIPEQDRQTYCAKFNIGALLRSSFKEQADSFAVLIDKEIINPNEAREKLDLNPYPGGHEYKTRTSTTKKDTGGNEDET